MRLLNTKTLRLEEDPWTFRSRYAILSHRWREGEVLFEDMEHFDTCCKKGKAKIKAACGFAASEGHKYIWIDTCCINKASSAELSEAINSMFAWYRDAEICYAYLDDVSSSDNGGYSEIGNSVWFSRCWTLQELLAPKRVLFLDRECKTLGDPSKYDYQIHESTGIPLHLLQVPTEKALHQ